MLVSVVNTLMLKILYQGQGPTLSYRSLFTKHMGLTTTQTGLVLMIDRIFGVFSPPLLGVVSDKLKRPASVIAWVYTLCAIAMAAVVFIPNQQGKFVLQ